MSDDKSQRREPGRSRVAGGEEYEVDRFAQKHGPTGEQGRKPIDLVGDNREKLGAEAAEIAEG